MSEREQKKNGKLHQVTLGDYPEITLDAARSLASTYLDQAHRGISPVKALEAAATAGGLQERVSSQNRAV